MDAFDIVRAAQNCPVGCMPPAESPAIATNEYIDHANLLSLRPTADCVQTCCKRASESVALSHKGIVMSWM